MSLFKNFITSAASDVVGAVGDALDKNITNKEEKMELKKQLTEIITNFQTQAIQASAEVVKVEASGNWLQRSWRPIVMLAFAFIVVYRYFLSQVFNLPAIELPVDFWGLLEIGLGGYVIGRSFEKVTKNLTENIDIIPDKLKKK